MNAQEYHARFKDCPWYLEEFPMVSIGGVGGIGSWLAFFLGRIGVPMGIYEDDFVDYTNLGGQLYSRNHIGQSKAEIVRDLVYTFSGNTEVRTLGRFEGQTVAPVTFACFDNMAARRLMFETWLATYPVKRIGTPSIFIDGRMTVESFQIIAVTQEMAEQYRSQYLFDDTMVADPICSMKATSHIGAQIGSQMTQVFTNHITNCKLGYELREVPFFQAYETVFMGNL